MNDEPQSLSKKERKALKKQEKIEQRARQKRSVATKRIIFWIVLVLAVAGGLWWITASPDNASPLSDPYEVRSEDHFKGAPSGELVLVEYSDFQCPACATYYPVIEELVRNYGSQLKFVYRHFPLTTIHSNAIKAARASEAASMQGKFWEMHAMIFERQNEWSDLSNPTETFVGYAEQIGIDVEQFTQDIESQAVRDRVSADQSEGRRLGISGTPTFYLNGEKIENPRGYDAFEALIAAALPQESDSVEGQKMDSRENGNATTTATTTFELTPDNITESSSENEPLAEE